MRNGKATADLIEAVKAYLTAIDDPLGASVTGDLEQMAGLNGLVVVVHAGGDASGVHVKLVITADTDEGMQGARTRLEGKHRPDKWFAAYASRP
jgi:hypothetical protein